MFFQVQQHFVTELYKHQLKDKEKLFIFFKNL